jgi:hypothetical protein
MLGLTNANFFIFLSAGQGNIKIDFSQFFTELQNDSWTALGTNVCLGDLTHQTIPEHGAAGVGRVECHSNGVKQASEAVWDHMPVGETGPQFHIRRGVFRIGWRGWSTHNDDTRVWHGIFCWERDACEAFKLHFLQVGDVNPVPSNPGHLIVVVFGRGIGCGHDRGL